MWFSSIFLLYKRQTIRLHKLMLYFFIFKFCTDAVCLFKIAICTSTTSFFFEIIKASMTSVTQTFLATLITFLCLGIDVVSDSFTHNHYLKIIGIGVTCYLIFNSYYLLGIANLSIKTWCGMLVVLFCGFMNIHVFFMSAQNLKGFYIEFNRLNNQDMNDIRTAHATKIKLYFIFCFITMLYYMGLILEHGYLFVEHVTNKLEYTLEGIKALGTCFVYLAVAFLFHPSLFTPSFRLAQLTFSNVLTIIIYRPYHPITIKKYLSSHLQLEGKKK